MECSSQDYVPETVNLREYCELIQYGFTQSASEAKIGPKFLRITDIQKNPVDWSTVPYCEISKEDFRKYLLEPGDIVIARTGASTGTSAIYKENMPESVFASYLIRIRPTAAFLPDFVYYFLQSASYKEHVKSIVGGSAQPNANAVQLTNVQIPLMTIEAQKQVCKLLGCLDNNISTNIEMSKTLEEIARAIFKHWFIDFEFPNENGEPYKSSGGEMIDSPLGPIPKGWRIGRIEDVCEVIMGQSPPGSTYNEEGNGLPFFQGNRDFGFRFPNKRIFCSGPTRQAREGDVLISVRAPVGSLNVAQETCCVGRGLAVLRPKEHYGFIFYYLKTQKHRWDAFSSEGTVFGSLRRQDLAQMEVPIPEDRLYYEFNNLVESLDTLTFINEKGINSLTELRDALLPKLMSGEIRVTDIEDKLGRGSNAEST